MDFASWRRDIYIWGEKKAAHTGAQQKKKRDENFKVNNLSLE